MQLARIVLDRMRADEIGPGPQLVFSSDEHAGWRRRKRGRGFSYFADNGERPGAAELAQINALAIPLAWSDVWICKDARGHIQATGRDGKGRKQYCYHAQWIAQRSATKFGTLVKFANALRGLRERVETDLRRQTLSFERVAGVSGKTVSRVVNREPNVTPGTIEKVQLAIDSLGYIPNLAARSIRSSRSNIIGIITDYVSTTPYSGDIVRGMQDWDLLPVQRTIVQSEDVVVGR